jgi:sec-independent protein translocase protein TatC
VNLFSEKNLNVLKDLRGSLIRVLVVCGLIFFVALFFVEKLMLTLSKIIGTKLILYSLPEAFMSYLKVALFVALLAAIPYVIAEAVRIMGKYTSQSGSALYPFIAAGTTLFYMGTAFCYAVVLPSGIKFLLQYQTENIKPMISLSAYISFFFTFIFVFGVMFELPLIMFVLGRLGILTVKTLNKQRRFFILANSILSAVLTPTPDVFNMMLTMIPMQVLYELGVIIVWLTGSQRLQKTSDCV